MRISKIKVSNFKSLVDFEIDLSKFNCIIGLNGSGKSTFLQFVDFLSQLMKGKIQDWLHRRQWNAKDLLNGFSDSNLIDFSVSFCNSEGRNAGKWFGQFDVSKLYCVSETIQMDGYDVTIKERKYSVSRYGRHENIQSFEENVVFSYEGSMLSRNIDNRMPPSHIQLKNYIAGLGVFDLLSPHFLRKKTKRSGGSIGLWGRGLSSYFFEIDEATKTKIMTDLAEMYPRFHDIFSSAIPFGWKQLSVHEEFLGRILETESHHVSDGLLRIAAILAEIHSEKQTLVFDEIENGINQELVELLLKKLVDAQQQSIVTTHSPLFLNYLDDDCARDSVQYFYKTPEGVTHCRKIFSIPSVAKKLGLLGPGEAIADTNLYRLNVEIEKLDTPFAEQEN